MWDQSCYSLRVTKYLSNHQLEKSLHVFMCWCGRFVQRNTAEDAVQLAKGTGCNIAGLDTTAKLLLFFKGIGHEPVDRSKIWHLQIFIQLKLKSSNCYLTVKMEIAFTVSSDITLNRWLLILGHTTITWMKSQRNSTWWVLRLKILITASQGMNSNACQLSY